MFFFQIARINITFKGKLMNFYIIDRLDQAYTHADGIEVTLMSGIFKNLSKSSAFKTMEDIAGYEIVVLSEPNLSFTHEEGLAYRSKYKKIEFALIRPGEVFSISQDKEQFAGKIYRDMLVLSENLEKLEILCFKPDPTQYSQIELKVIEWLESGQTGLSSLALCKAAFPQTQYYKLDKMIERDLDNYPHDNADFKRCMLLIEQVPEIRQKMPELSGLNQKWQNLFTHWDNIESLIIRNKAQEAYDLIKQCTKDSPKPKI